MAADGAARRRAFETWVATAFARQRTILQGLVDAAETATDRLEQCLGWMAVKRQAECRLRGIDELWPATRPSVPHTVVNQRRYLHERIAEAQARSAAFPSDVYRAARGQLGMRVAFVGKGGAGKSMLSSTLSRVLAQRGRQVLAVDLDPNPGMAYGLGMAVTNLGLPDEAIESTPGGFDYQLAAGLHPVDAVEAFATVGPDGVRFLGIGKIVDPQRLAMQRSMNPLMQILFNFGPPRWDVIGDLEAGTHSPFARFHTFADLVVMIVGPSWKSALTIRRLGPILGEVPTILVANGFTDEPDHPDLVPVARVPFDLAVVEAERGGLSLIDEFPDAPAVQAIGRLADLLVGEEVLV